MVGGLFYEKIFNKKCYYFPVLKFQPKEGSIVYCDYAGFVVPEMVKKRPIIVIHKHRHNSKLVCVVPISTTEPIPILDFHIEIEKSFYMEYLNGKKSWVKCDMINTVSLDRLYLVRDKKSGIRHAPRVDLEFLRKVKDAVRKEHNL
jgi:uncharacterized protein YifN (PemK superfamily)